MARSFTGREARQLLKQHRALADQLERCSAYAAARRQDAAALVSTLAGRNVFLSRMAEELHTGVARTDVTPDLAQLIHTLDQYALSLPLSEAGGRLQQAQGRLLAQQADRLKPAANGLAWLLASRQTRDAAQAAYAQLLDAAAGAYAWQVEALGRDLAQVTQQGQDSALRHFHQDGEYFRQVLMRAVPDAALQGAPLPEIAAVVADHQALLRQMDAAQDVLEGIRDQIRAAAGQLITSATLDVLRQTAIEELGRERPGVRFKALREHGYQTVADVFCATQPNLASVYGVSDDTAHALKQYAQQYAQQARAGVKIRLSMDDQSAPATALVCAIHGYRQRSSAAEVLGALRSTHEGAVTQGLRALQQIQTGVVWSFALPGEKQRLAQTFHQLAGMLHGEYARDALDCVHTLNRPLSSAPAAAWEDFARNPIIYANILEKLVPGVLGGNDAWFGLPEELARSIQEQDFFPEGLKCELRRYQEWGVKYILHQERVLLGDEMGLGKTVQAIASMVSLRNTGATHFMVVCPASVVPNWCREIASKSRLRVTKIHGAGRASAFRDWQKNGGVAVTNFETTSRLVMEEGFTFDMLVVDEAHYIKNPQARRTQGVALLAEHAPRLVYMTGTALENRVDEMIGLIGQLRPALVPELEGLSHLSAAPAFRERIAPVYFRRKREDVLTELPEMIRSTEWCVMSPRERADYEGALMRNAHPMTLRQLSWDTEDLADSCKAARLKEIVAQAAEEGRKVLVFSFFLGPIQRIREHLGTEVCLPPIHGSLPPQCRQEIINDFDHAPAGSVLLAQIQSGGTGLNIQSASVVVMCEPQLKPSIEEQAISRAYRMGQARSVLVYRLLCEDTIDERIDDLLARKAAAFRAFADQSASAQAAAQEEAALDQQSLQRLIQEEIERIKARNAEPAT